MQVLSVWVQYAFVCLNLPHSIADTTWQSIVAYWKVCPLSTWGAPGLDEDTDCTEEACGDGFHCEAGNKVQGVTTQSCCVIYYCFGEMLAPDVYHLMKLMHIISVGGCPRHYVTNALDAGCNAAACDDHVTWKDCPIGSYCPGEWVLANPSPLKTFKHFCIFTAQTFQGNGLKVNCTIPGKYCPR